MGADLYWEKHYRNLERGPRVLGLERQVAALTTERQALRDLVKRMLPIIEEMVRADDRAFEDEDELEHIKQDAWRLLKGIPDSE